MRLKIHFLFSHFPADNLFPTLQRLPFFGVYLFTHNSKKKITSNRFGSKSDDRFGTNRMKFRTFRLRFVILRWIGPQVWVRKRGGMTNELRGFRAGSVEFIKKLSDRFFPLALSHPECIHARLSTWDQMVIMLLGLWQLHSVRLTGAIGG